MNEQHGGVIDSQGRRIVDLLEERGYEERDHSRGPVLYSGGEYILKRFRSHSSKAGILFDKETEDLSYVTLNLSNHSRGIHSVEPDEVKEAIEFFQEEERVKYGEYIEIEAQETSEETEELVAETLDAAQTMEKLGMP